MSEPLPALLIGAALLLAAVATVYVALDRPTGLLLLGGFGLLELGLVVQAVLGIVELAGTDRDVDGVTLVGYLLGALLFVPAGVAWALGERSRAGTAALIIVGLVVPFLVLRTGQIWDAGA
jgi:hypothetical protein